MFDYFNKSNNIYNDDYENDLDRSINDLYSN